MFLVCVIFFESKYTFDHQINLDTNDHQKKIQMVTR
jgi:hypothetical protein